ncbi:thioredoxin family protein [Candidatus Stoquefichus massiliensis]|uniref:thioredoxin family protein n=1 Tax=Candidatus Stoquefichus massiliensis TaxID=1470350 RepID=UPI000481427F|nr:thioredoxin family protein [Candidatus Stoquefichus massiliensis]
MDKLIKINDLKTYEEAISKGQAMMVFSTTWCPDCHFLKTFIDELVNENPQWTFYYIDRDDMVDLCIDLEIMGIPSFVAYKDGHEVSRLVNKLRKTKNEIQAFIDAIE